MGDNIQAYTFEVKGKVPPEAVEGFCKTNAIVLNLRGYVKQKAKDVFIIYVEGAKSVVDKFKDIILTYGAFVAQGCQVVLKSAKEIKSYTQPKFTIEIKTK